MHHCNFKCSQYTLLLSSLRFLALFVSLHSSLSPLFCNQVSFLVIYTCSMTLFSRIHFAIFLRSSVFVPLFTFLSCVSSLAISILVLFFLYFFPFLVFSLPLCFSFPLCPLDSFCIYTSFSLLFLPLLLHFLVFLNFRFIIIRIVHPFQLSHNFYSFPPSFSF